MLNIDVEHDVLAFVEGDLDLRNDAVADVLVTRELASRGQLHHRRPRAAELTGGGCPAESGTEKGRIFGFVLVGSELETELRLQKEVGGEDLAPQDNRFEDRGAVAETALVCAGRQDELTGHRDDRALFVIVVEGVLDRDRDVPHRGGPAGRGFAVDRL
jgi:hypothetical protein